MTGMRRLRSGDEGGHRSYFIFSPINIPAYAPSVKHFFLPRKYFSAARGKIPTVMYFGNTCRVCDRSGTLRSHRAAVAQPHALDHAALRGSLLYVHVLSGAAQLPFWAKCLISAAAISLLELAVGYLVNIILGWAVWDYSDRPLNILGQICPLYSFFWLLLSAPALALCGLIKSRFGL